MENVVSLDERRKAKIRGSIEKTLLKSSLRLKPKFISDLLVNAHPMTIKHKAEGRILYGNVGKEHTFSVMVAARKAGFTDLQVERTAIYAYGGSIHVLPDCFSVYGRPLRTVP